MVPSIKVIRILKQKKSSINYFLNYFRLGFIWVWPYSCPARAQVNPISSHTVFQIRTHLRPIFALSLDAVDIQPSMSITGNVWPPPWSTRMHIIFLPIILQCSGPATDFVDLYGSSPSYSKWRFEMAMIDAIRLWLIIARCIYMALGMHCILHLLWIVMPKMFRSSN